MFQFHWALFTFLGILSFSSSLGTDLQDGYQFSEGHATYRDPGDTEIQEMSPENHHLLKTVKLNSTNQQNIRKEYKVPQLYHEVVSYPQSENGLKQQQPNTKLRFPPVETRSKLPSALFSNFSMRRFNDVVDNYKSDSDGVSSNSSAKHIIPAMHSQSSSSNAEITDHLVYRKSSQEDSIYFPDRDSESPQDNIQPTRPGGYTQEDKFPPVREGNNYMESTTSGFYENVNGIEHFYKKEPSPSSTSGTITTNPFEDLTTESNLPHQGILSNRYSPIGNGNRGWSTNSNHQSSSNNTENLVNTRGGNQKLATGFYFSQNVKPGSRDPLPNAYVVYAPQGIAVPGQTHFNNNSVHKDVQSQTSQKQTQGLVAYSPVGIISAGGYLPIIRFPEIGQFPSTTDAPSPTTTTRAYGADTDIYVPASKIITDIYKYKQIESATGYKSVLHSSENVTPFILREVTSGSREGRKMLFNHVVRGKGKDTTKRIHDDKSGKKDNTRKYFRNFHRIRQHSLKYPQSDLAAYNVKKKTFEHRFERHRPSRAQTIIPKKNGLYYHDMAPIETIPDSTQQNTKQNVAFPENISHLSQTDRIQADQFDVDRKYQHLLASSVMRGKLRKTRSLSDPRVIKTDHIISTIISRPLLQMGGILVSSQRLNDGIPNKKPSLSAMDELSNSLLTNSGETRVWGSPQSSDGSNNKISFSNWIAEHSLPQNSSQSSISNSNNNSKLAKSANVLTKKQLELKYSVFKKKQNEFQSTHSFNLGQFISLKLDNSTNFNPKVFGGQYLNELADFIIDVVNTGIRIKGKSNISLPDVDKYFNEKVIGIKLYGEFHGKNGWFLDLSSLQRTADVSISGSNYTLFVQFSIALKNVRFGFGYCRVGFVGIYEEGKLTGDVTSNSMKVKLAVTINRYGNCRIALDDFKVAQLGDINLDIDGPSEIKWLFNEINSWIISDYKDEIIKKIEGEIMTEVNIALGRVKC